MPPSDCGVHELAEFAIEYANFSLFSERFFTYPILMQFVWSLIAFAMLCTRSMLSYCQIRSRVIRHPTTFAQRS